MKGRTLFGGRYAAVISHLTVDGGGHDGDACRGSSGGSAAGDTDGVSLFVG
jgi:hypothetical protein